MRVFMIGGTGLLGSEGAKALIENGHEVSTLSLPPIPAGSMLPEEMDIDFGNYLEMTDDEIRQRLDGCDGFVFAAGVDERIPATSPVYDFFKRHNIDPLRRFLAIAKECGVKHAVVLGSYFSWANRTMPELDLYQHHPYIRSRVDQAEMALSFADENMSVAVLEIPYVFGSQAGRKPVWVFLVEQIMNMKDATVYPEGGTTMVTIRQVGQAIAGAIKHAQSGNYPVGYYNMQWSELLSIMHKYMNCEEKKIIIVPKEAYISRMKEKGEKERQCGIEGGLDTAEFAKVFTSRLFIDKEMIVKQLGVEADDIDQAIGESVRLSMKILEGKTSVIDMTAV
jgi:dihydroflavonol-4-reductase